MCSSAQWPVGSYVIMAAQGRLVTVEVRALLLQQQVALRKRKHVVGADSQTGVYRSLNRYRPSCWASVAPCS